MQKLNTVLIVLLAIALGYLWTSSKSSPESPVSTNEASDKETEATDEVLSIVFVDLDTLNAKFTFLNDKLELMRSEQQRQQRNFERKAKAANDRYLSLQETAYTMTQDQIEAAGKELEGAEKSLQAEQERITSELLALENSIQTELDARITKHLDSLKAARNYDYILAKAAGSGVLASNETLDITQEVLKALNDAYAAELATQEK